MQYQIGEFSQISRLSIKTLRYYHEEELLLPSSVDAYTGYRYYDENCLHRARVITSLKGLDFTIREIREILDKCEDDEDLEFFLQQKTAEIRRKIRKYRNIEKTLKDLLSYRREQPVPPAAGSMREEVLQELLVASIRYIGSYDMIGKYITRLYREAGNAALGGPLTLYHTVEYRENDADVEVCIPIRKEIKHEDIRCRTLPEVRAVLHRHQGPYTTVGEGYRKVFDFVLSKNRKISPPLREIYIRGPGMIFRGNPGKYITELQVPFEEPS